MRSIVITVICLLFVLSPIRATSQAVQTRLSDMTLEQKIAQMFMVGFFTTQLTEVERDFLRDVHPGAVVLLGQNVESPEQVTRLINDYQQTIVDGGGLPMFIAVDQEGGRIQHLHEGFTQFPLPMLWRA